MIVEKNRLALTYLAVFDFYIYDKYDFVFLCFTKMDYLRPSLKMLHEIFNHF